MLVTSVRVQFVNCSHYLKPYNPGGGGVLPYIDYRRMCHWPGYGFQALEFGTAYINQENNVGNRVYNYVKLINSLIQVAINFLERHMDTYQICVILFSLKQGWVLGIQFRTGYQNQAKSSLEQGQVSGIPAAHPHQNFCSVPPGHTMDKISDQIALHSVQ